MRGSCPASCWRRSLRPPVPRRSADCGSVPGRCHRARLLSSLKRWPSGRHAFSLLGRSPVSDPTLPTPLSLFQFSFPWFTGLEVKAPLVQLGPQVGLGAQIRGHTTHPLRRLAAAGASRRGQRRWGSVSTGSCQHFAPLPESRAEARGILSSEWPCPSQVQEHVQACAAAYTRVHTCARTFVRVVVHVCGHVHACVYWCVHICTRVACACVHVCVSVSRAPLPAE